MKFFVEQQTRLADGTVIHLRKSVKDNLEAMTVIRSMVKLGFLFDDPIINGPVNLSESSLWYFPIAPVFNTDLGARTQIRINVYGNTVQLGDGMVIHYNNGNIRHAPIPGDWGQCEHGLERRGTQQR